MRETSWVVTAFIFGGIAVILFLAFVYVWVIHQLGFYGNQAVLVGFLGLIIIGFVIKRVQASWESKDLPVS